MRRLALALVVALFLGAAALLATTNHSYVTTPSMYPAIPPGSMIFVSPKDEYQVGDVIEFRANGLVWAHRLVEITPDGEFLTKGDNPQNAPDAFVPGITEKDVIGAVTHSVRWLGFPELILHHPAYGLGWLRAELGDAGRIALVVAVGLLALLLSSSSTGSAMGTSPRRGRPHNDTIDLTGADGGDTTSEGDPSSEPTEPTSDEAAIVLPDAERDPRAATV